MQTYKKELKPYLYLGVFLFVIGFGIGNFFWLLPGTDYFSKTNYLFTKDILTYIEQTFYRFFITPSLLGFSVGVLGFLLGLLMYVRDNDRGIYRHGEEYGSARFATPAEMKKYEDPIPENNIIVSKHVKISLFNKRLPIKLQKNKNIAILGDSGAAKTLAFIKTNLMQRHASFITTDPDGGILPEIGLLLKKGKYKIKVLDLNTLSMSEKTQMKQKSQPELTLEEIIKKKDYQKLSQHLNDGIKEYLTSDTFKNYLDFASKFHKYSSKNIRLLLAQNPNIRRVAGYNAWKKLDRQVKKGSKALYVYAPYFKDKIDKNGKKVTDENGEIVKETRYFLTPVFDVEQTTGAELPQLVYNLEENLSDGKTFTRTYNALVEICPVPVTVTSIASGANGYYDPTKKEIVLQQHLGEVMTLKVLLHEMTHAMLHPDSQAIFGDDVYSRQEFEAESVAYIVSRHLGLDTSSYSFGYLSSWTKQGEKLEEFTQSLETITKEARTLIEKADHALSIEKGIQLPQNKFEERLLNAKKKETEVGKSQANEQKRQQNEPKISAQIANPTRF